jgi:hypothetical protein
MYDLQKIHIATKDMEDLLRKISRIIDLKTTYNCGEGWVIHLKWRARFQVNVSALISKCNI